MWFNFQAPKGKEKRYIALGASLLYPSVGTYAIGLSSHAICSFLEGEGPSCFYSAISGARLAMGGTRNNVLAAIIVAVNISDYDLPMKSQLAHIGATIFGYLAHTLIVA